MTVPVDAEVLLVAYLAGHPALAPLHGGRVGTQLDRGRPALRVTRIGGVAEDTGEDTPELQVEAWAPTQDAASVLIRTVVSALGEIAGVHPEGAVRGHELHLGPLWSPDPDTEEPRYLISFALLIYAHV